MKLNKILRNFFIVFIGFLITLNFMASPALAYYSPSDYSSAIPLGDHYGSFEVYANDGEGVAVYNPSLGYGEHGDYMFLAEGVWQGGPATPECDSCGVPDWQHDYMTDPKYDPFSLIINCDNGLEYEDCWTPQISLTQDETCVLKMNDQPGTYYDNTGFLTVHYQRMN